MKVDRLDQSSCKQSGQILPCSTPLIRILPALFQMLPAFGSPLLMTRFVKSLLIRCMLLSSAEEIQSGAQAPRQAASSG